MAYPDTATFKHLATQIELYGQLQHEYGAAGIDSILRKAERELRSELQALRHLPPDPDLAEREPNDLEAIRALRPKGPRVLWETFEKKRYADKIAGAFLARCAGCTLGSPVEFWTMERMENLARELKMNFPPTRYWTRVPDPFEKRYGMSERRAYTASGMKGVPVDDDIVYTLLGLLVVEQYGPGFTVAENGKAWRRYLPHACTAEEVALDNLKKKILAEEAGATNNPYCEWIGADIRADSWGYMAPGWPECAADMAYRDAILSHRRNGVYGEMFFAAAISAAFAVDDPLEALRIGLTEIPRQCALAKAVRWALKKAPSIRDYRQAREAVERKCKGMSGVHTINNACLTVFGLALGGTDVTRVIGETVAMGLDNDCTAATAGSVVGAVVGKKGVPARWIRPFDNTVRSYLKGQPRFRVDDLLKRFARQAQAVYARRDASD